MAIEGQLGPGSVADLVAALWHSERTGFLDLVSGGVERKLVLAHGAVVYVLSSDPTEKLAVRLVTSGAATKEQVLVASKAGGDFRQALAAAGADPGAHDRVLHGLVEDVLRKAFLLESGKWSLHDRNDIEFPGGLDDIDMTSLLWAGARSLPEAAAEKLLGPLGTRLMKTGHDEIIAEIKDLSPQEGFLLSRIDGYGSAADLFTLLPLPREQVLGFIAGLVLVGYADLQGRPGVKLPRPAKSSGRKKKPAAAASTKPSGPVISTAGALPGMAQPAAPEPELDGVDAARAMLGRIKDSDHYAVIGVKPDADDDEVRKAYYRLARLYHPDRFGKDLAGSDREVVEELFGRVSEAFGVLSNEERRRDYDERLKSGAIAAEKEAEKPVDSRDLARMSFEKGKALITLGDRSRALSFLEHAAETDPETWDYRIALAKLLMSESRLRKKAETQLHAAIAIDQSKPEAYLLLGQVYKLGGVKSRAIEQFREGLRWDPGNDALRRELDELESTGEAAKSGGLGGLFKKK